MTGFLGQRHSTERKHGRIHISISRCGERKVSGTRWWRSHGMFSFQAPYFAFVCAYLADICLIGNIVSQRLFNQKIHYSITVTTQINNISLLCLIGIWNFILCMFYFIFFFLKKQLLGNLLRSANYNKLFILHLISLLRFAISYLRTRPAFLLIPSCCSGRCVLRRPEN